MREQVEAAKAPAVIFALVVAGVRSARLHKQHDRPYTALRVLCRIGRVIRLAQLDAQPEAVGHCDIGDDIVHSILRRHTLTRDVAYPLLTLDSECTERELQHLVAHRGVDPPEPAASDTGAATKPSG